MSEAPSVVKVDIVIDTNVMSHSANPNCVDFPSALAVIEWLRNSSISLVFDDLGKNKPDPSTSLLYTEYRNTLPIGSAAMVLVMTMLQQGRVTFSSRPARTQAEKINGMLPKNKKDRAVLGAALGSVDKVLVTNDWSDFSQKVRSRCLKEFSVHVLSSREAT